MYLSSMSIERYHFFSQNSYLSGRRHTSVRNIHKIVGIVVDSSVHVSGLVLGSDVAKCSLRGDASVVPANKASFGP